MKISNKVLEEISKNSHKKKPVKNVLFCGHGLIGCTVCIQMKEIKKGEQNDCS